MIHVKIEKIITRGGWVVLFSRWTGDRRSTYRYFLYNVLTHCWLLRYLTSRRVKHSAFWTAVELGMLLYITQKMPLLEIHLTTKPSKGFGDCTFRPRGGRAYVCGAKHSLYRRYAHKSHDFVDIIQMYDTVRHCCCTVVHTWFISARTHLNQRMLRRHYFPPLVVLLLIYSVCCDLRYIIVSYLPCCLWQTTSASSLLLPLLQWMYVLRINIRIFRRRIDWFHAASPTLTFFFLALIYK